MEKINKWMSKKNIAIVGFVGFFATCIFLQRSIGDFIYEYCQSFPWGGCMNTINYFELLLLFFSGFFIPSVILLSLKNEVFEFWKKTIFIYLFIYLFIILGIPWRLGGSGDWPAIGKGSFALLSVVLYSLISIAIIFYKSLKKNS